MSKKLILFLILLGGFFLRVYDLGKFPVSVSWDEAAIGYNAYSVLKTGKDEYGARLPLLFKSFSDYKLPGYIYTTSLSTAFFGLNAFAVRLPSAVFGTLTILALYFLVAEAFRKKGYETLPLLASGILAISPWHLQFSRGGFEANGQLFFLTVAYWLFLRALRRPKSYLLGAIFLALSFYFYYTTRVLTPLLGLAFFGLFRRQLWQQKKTVILAGVVFLLVITPLIPGLLGKSNNRISQVAIFNDGAANIPYVQALARHPDSLLAKIIYNRRLVYAHNFLENYFRNNSLEYFFVSGDLYPRHDVVGMGVLYLWELPFLLVGLFTLLRWPDRKKWFIVAWLVFGAVPASLTTGAPHALRTLSTLPVFSLLTALGLVAVFKELLVKHYRLRLLFGGLTLAAAGFLFISYLYFYYDLSARYYAIDWGDGHQQLVDFIVKNESQYDEVWVTGTYFKPYIYFLFYSQYDPARYQTEGGSDKGFYKYRFFPADWEPGGQTIEDIDFSGFDPQKRTLLVFHPSFVKKYLRTVKEIRSLNTKDVFVLQETPRVQNQEL